MLNGMVERAPTTSSADAEGQGEVLLLVEDDALRAELTTLLREGGHQVTAVASIREARLRLSASTPATFLIDAPDAASELRDLLAELAERDEAPPTLLCAHLDAHADMANDYDIERLEKPFGRYGFLTAMRRAREERRRPSQRRLRAAPV